MTKLPRLYIFGWPGAIGGASTKMAHLLRLLHRRFPLVVVPNDARELKDAIWVEFMRGLDIETLSYEQLAQQLHGWGLAMCNFDFLISPHWAEVRARGLKMAWSNEMMWTEPRELGALFTGIIDQVLYVSEVQREAQEPRFHEAWTGSFRYRKGEQPRGALTGEIKDPGSGRALRWTITGNYIDPALFPPKEFRLKERYEPLVIGRLSRPDPAKFPEDFPSFYEGLGVRDAKFRVMAWSEELRRRWRDHPFDARWELLPALQEDPSSFLRSLDLFVYSLRPDLRESWGRCVVEAMLSGAVPILPDSGDHHLHNLVIHGHSGFLCRSADEFGEYARLLDHDRELLLRCSRNAREDAVHRHCNAAAHRRYWEAAFPEL
jgi:glycosyltransferase involved in cell wall biosynthesis